MYMMYIFQICNKHFHIVLLDAMFLAVPWVASKIFTVPFEEVQSLQLQKSALLNVQRADLH